MCWAVVGLPFQLLSNFPPIEGKLEVPEGC